MICLACSTALEKSEQHYHKSCLKKLFGKSRLPEINLNLNDIAVKTAAVSPQMSISGMQPKLSLRLNSDTNELELTSSGGEYILKPQTQDFVNLPENENICMSLAQAAGLNTPPHALLRLLDGSWAYIVKRFDRVGQKKIHQEDFQQILNINMRDKYNGSYEQIGKKILELSSAPGLDIQLFYEMVLFSFIIGNGDAHTKNFSLQYFENGETRLSPAYDLVSSRLAIPSEKSELALSMRGRQNNIQKTDFQYFADYLKIPKSAPINKILDYENVFIDMIAQTDTLTDKQKNELMKIINDRIERLR